MEEGLKLNKKALIIRNKYKFRKKLQLQLHFVERLLMELLHREKISTEHKIVQWLLRELASF